MANKHGWGFKFPSGSHPNPNARGGYVFPSARAPGTGMGGVNEPANNIIGGEIDFSNILETINSITDTITISIIEYLQKIFAPVQVDFSIDLLSAQINGISIVLFIITICILLFFISLLFNFTVFIFSDKLLSYFKNKYVVWYLKLNNNIWNNHVKLMDILLIV